jgi:hypothetical protein
VSVTWIYRPIDAWPGELTKDRKCTPFRAKFGSTLDLLTSELEHLGAREAVIQLALDPQDLRRDGLPRAGARPDHPGVILSFESYHGPLRYFTDAFKACWANDGEGWHANLRAIALGLQDLRRLDRYGIGRRGEQYTGWAQLPPGQPMGPAVKMTVEEAARILADAYPAGASAEEILEELQDEDRPFLRDAYRMGTKRLHPDQGGDPEAFRRLSEARDLLTAMGRSR